MSMPARQTSNPSALRFAVTVFAVTVAPPHLNSALENAAPGTLEVPRRSCDRPPPMVACEPMRMSSTTQSDGDPPMIMRSGRNGPFCGREEIVTDCPGRISRPLDIGRIARRVDGGGPPVATTARGAAAGRAGSPGVDAGTPSSAIAGAASAGPGLRRRAPSAAVSDAAPRKNNLRVGPDARSGGSWWLTSAAYHVACDRGHVSGPPRRHRRPTPVIRRAAPRARRPDPRVVRGASPRRRAGSAPTAGSRRGASDRRRTCGSRRACRRPRRSGAPADRAT
jgi:hypothetical protein